MVYRVSMQKFYSVLCISLVFILLFVVAVVSNETPKYGEFDLNLETFEPCNGPKRKSCSVVQSKIVGKNSVSYDLTLDKNMKPTKGKIVAMSNGNQLVRLQVDNPCDHLYLRPLFKLWLNVTEDCVIVKGHYSFNIDMDRIAQTYYHGSFFYGEMTFKSTFYNNDCNLSCTTVKVSMSPKHSTV